MTVKGLKYKCENVMFSINVKGMKLSRQNISTLVAKINLGFSMLIFGVL